MVGQINSSDTMSPMESTASDRTYEVCALPGDPPSALLLRDMSVSALAEHCLTELTRYRRGASSQEQYGLELFRRAVTQRDPLAWERVQQYFHQTMLHWMRAHPLKEVACRFKSEEHYVAQAFARFWLATVAHHQMEFQTLSGALRYLQMSLNATVRDTVRAYARPKEVPLPEFDERWEPLAEDDDERDALWEVLQRFPPHQREQRVAYLLWRYCNLAQRTL